MLAKAEEVEADLFRRGALSRAFQQRRGKRGEPREARVARGAAAAEVPAASGGAYQFKRNVTLGGETLQLTVLFEMKDTLTREQLLKAGLRGLSQALSICPA